MSESSAPDKMFAMRRGVIVASLFAMTASVAACTALLDLKATTFDAPVDGDGGEVGIDGASDDGNIVRPDGGDAASCASFGMGDGTVTSSFVTCGAGMVQLTTNTMHCGACNHSCGSSTCSDGRCESLVVIPQAGSEPIVLAASPTHVAWSAALDGGADTMVYVAAADGSDPRTLSTIYGQWAQAGAIAGDAVLVPVQNADTYAYPITGAPWFKVQGNNASKYIVSRGSDVFLETFEQTLRVIHVVPDGTKDDLVTDQSAIRAIALGDQYLYWVVGAKDDQGNPPRVARVHVVTKTVDHSDWQGDTSAVAVDGAFVYVFDHSRQELIRLASDLVGPGEVISKWTGVPWDYATTIIADGEYIYVRVNKGGASGAILRVPRCGGPPLVLQNIAALGRIAISGDYVYWGDLLSGTIRRVHK